MLVASDASGKGLEEPLPLLAASDTSGKGLEELLLSMAALDSLDTLGKGLEEPLPLLAPSDTPGKGLEEASSLEYSQYLELFSNSSRRDEKRRNQSVLDYVFQAWYTHSHGSCG